MATFDSVGDTILFRAYNQNTNLLVTVGSGFTGTIELQRELFYLCNVFVFVKKWDVAGSAFTDNYFTVGKDERVRLIVTAATSGSATVTVAAQDRNEVTDLGEAVENLLRYDTDLVTILTDQIDTGSAQPASATLTLVAGLTPAADKVPYFTGASGAALATVTTAGRALIDDADAAAQRTTLGLGTMAVKATTDFNKGFLSAFFPSTTAADGTITLFRKPPFAFTVDSVTCKTASGTITAAFKISGTNITSLDAVSVTSTEASTSATGANSVSTTDRLDLVLSSNSLATDLSVTVAITRT